MPENPDADLIRELARESEVNRRYIRAVMETRKPTLLGRFLGWMCGLDKRDREIARLMDEARQEGPQHRDQIRLAYMPERYGEPARHEAEARIEAMVRYRQSLLPWYRRWMHLSLADLFARLKRKCGE